MPICSLPVCNVALTPVTCSGAVEDIPHGKFVQTENERPRIIQKGQNDLRSGQGNLIDRNVRLILIRIPLQISELSGEINDKPCLHSKAREPPGKIFSIFRARIW